MYWRKGSKFFFFFSVAHGTRRHDAERKIHTRHVRSRFSAAEEPEETSPSTCSNGIPGIDAGGKVCCPIGCNQCGGPGCSSSGAASGLGWGECCGSGVKATKPLCSLSGEAPCLIDEGER